MQAPWDIPETKPDRYWPPEGQVSVDNYSTRYRPGLELVLNQISFGVNPGEKVCILSLNCFNGNQLRKILLRHTMIANLLKGI